MDGSFPLSARGKCAGSDSGKVGEFSEQPNCVEKVNWQKLLATLRHLYSRAKGTIFPSPHAHCKGWDKD